MRSRITICGLVLTYCIFLSVTSYGARIKDIAGISGVRDNQLIGYGLVVGLAGTGDDMKNQFTNESLANLLTRQGLSMAGKALTIKANNTAAVMVTATLPPFAKQGTKLDVIISSIGNSKTLQGGTLLMTPLRAADGEIYAVAQGALTLGGFTVGGEGSEIVKNHPTAGRISNGALVERELRYDFEKSKTLTINLFHPDFTTAVRLASAINSMNDQAGAKAVDSASIFFTLPSALQGNIFEVISQIENLDVPVDSRAVVVMNEKTGTVVMGENVRISTVAIAHGNLSIQIKEEKSVSQPLPFAPAPPAGSGSQPVKDGSVIVAPGAQTVVTTNKNIDVAEEKKQLVLVPQGVTIQDVIKALNAIGVTPRDLITIIQTIKAAGALQADLTII
ncbi:MAG: flagellar basal body P-ring protein FlgI [Syntrophales bacterium LBB04]|nr:flagellar basal body P-ring protein FlgI [Syntrophales bacterium LBB04]